MFHTNYSQFINKYKVTVTWVFQALLGTANADDNINSNDGLENNPGEIRESPFSKEKKQLLQLVQSLQENHDKEIDLMETSYR